MLPFYRGSLNNASQITDRDYLTLSFENHTYSQANTPNVFQSNYGVKSAWNSYSMYKCSYFADKTLSLNKEH